MTNVMARLGVEVKEIDGKPTPEGQKHEVQVFNRSKGLLEIVVIAAGKSGPRLAVNAGDLKKVLEALEGIYK
jgi:hypothetical protein